jgi:hypothetical protein
MKNTIALQLNPGPGNGRNSEGSFITLKDGRILFAWSKYITENFEDHDRSAIFARYSHDSGRSWLPEERLLIDPQKALNVMSVSLLRLQDRRILMLYMRKTDAGGGCVRCTPMVCFSDDEMETLSAPAPITLSPDYHVVNNDRVIQLKNGRLVVPINTHRFAMPSHTSANSITHPVFAAPALTFFLLSDDGGATWRESINSYYRCFPNGQGLQEPGVIELNDGRLWSWSRTGAGRQWQSFSTDGGQIWAEPEPSSFTSPCSPLSMKRIPSTGHLLAVWNDHSGRFPLPQRTSSSHSLADRNPLVCAISRNEGITWQHHSLLEDTSEHGFCYTAIHFVDNAVLLAYCAGGPSPQSCLVRLRLRRLALEEIYRTNG